MEVANQQDIVLNQQHVHVPLVNINVPIFHVFQVKMTAKRILYVM
jgi:hypothetical protein